MEEGWTRQTLEVPSNLDLAVFPGVSLSSQMQQTVKSGNTLMCFPSSFVLCIQAVHCRWQRSNRKEAAALLQSVPEGCKARSVGRGDLFY